MTTETIEPVMCTCGLRFRPLPEGYLVCPPCRVRVAKMRLWFCPCDPCEQLLADRERECRTFVGYESARPGDADAHEELLMRYGMPLSAPGSMAELIALQRELLAQYGTVDTATNEC